MADIGAIRDLQTLLTDATNGILGANLTNVTNGQRPKVILGGEIFEDDATGLSKWGVITLSRQVRQEEYVSDFYLNEIYTIPFSVVIEKMVADTDIDEMLEEIIRVLRVASQPLTRAYDYRVVDDTLQTNAQYGRIDGNFLLVKRFVVSSA